MGINKKYANALFVCMGLWGSFVFAQTNVLVEKIKNNTTQYLFAEGEGANLQEADQAALYNLTSQISLSVESSFETVAEWGKNNDFKERVQSVVKTYSNTTLNNAERIVVKQTSEKAIVFRYIKRENIAKVFASRLQKVREFVALANQYKEDYKVSEALRYYYWALQLLKSHPDQKTIKTAEVSPSQLLSIYLPQQINTILSSISLKFSHNYKEDGLQIVEGVFKYEGQKVDGITYSYWTGTDWVLPIASVDDKAIFQFGTATKQVDLKIEYAFRNETQIDDEIEKVFGSVGFTSFDKRAKKRMTLGKAAPKTHTKATLVSTQKSLKDNYKTADLGVYKLTTKQIQPYLEKMAVILQAIKSKKFDKIKEMSTSQGFQIAEKLLKYGNAYLLNNKELKAYKIDGVVALNGIPIQFSFQHNKKKFIENVVFRFNDKLLLEDITFAASKKTQQDILQQKKWDIYDKITIIEFLERYKTAYALKRLDYISSIFSDDALIIVGKVIKPVTNIYNDPDFGGYRRNPIIKQNRYTKKEFIKHLGYSFKRKEYINIKFEDVSIRRAGVKKNLYGIQIKQNYYSSNYGDTGYLFLMVDLKQQKQPIIHVRTWQPHKNADGSIYGMGDF